MLWPVSLQIWMLYTQWKEVVSLNYVGKGPVLYVFSRDVLRTGVSPEILGSSVAVGCHHSLAVLYLGDALLDASRSCFGGTSQRGPRFGRPLETAFDITTSISSSGGCPLHPFPPVGSRGNGQNCFVENSQLKTT